MSGRRSRPRKTWHRLCGAARPVVTPLLAVALALAIGATTVLAARGLQL